MEKNELAALLRRKSTIADLVKLMRDAQAHARRSPFTFPDMWLGDDVMGNASVQPQRRNPGVWRGGC